MENEYKNLSRECLEAELKKYKDIVDMFTNNVLGGVAKMSMKDMQIITATEGYYRMTGYSREESLLPPFSNCGLNLVIPEDTHRIQDIIGELQSKNKPIHVDYRIRKKDGTLAWNSAFCTGILENQQGKYIEVFFLDITQEKEQQRQNLLNEERFRIISEQTKDVIFEWDIENDSLHYSPVYEKVYGPKPAPGSTKELMESDLFYEEDKPIIKEIIENLRTSVPYAEFKIKIRLDHGSYLWGLHRVAVIRDENSKPSHAVGIISDVTDFMENAIDLQHKAEHDTLTGLLNRGMAQEYIGDILERQAQDVFHAFVQFDIDRFKQINDFMGHVAGDLALKKVAWQMRESFPKENILIRMGGDEFGIFIENIGNPIDLKHKLEGFLQAIRGDFMFEEKIYPISVSIGVAFCPRDGDTFQRLYENADTALYRAKRRGGDNIEYFGE